MWPALSHPASLLIGQSRPLPGEVPCRRAHVEPKVCKHDILLNSKTSVCTLFTDEPRILESLAKGAAPQEILKEYPKFEPNA